MDRNREARRTTMAANGLSRRRHRSSSLRDSPEEDGPVELQEPTRLRDRGTGKKDRERERERDRERDRDRLSRSSKRRRGDRLMHSSNREDGGDDTSEESVNDEEEDEDDDGTGGSVRMLPLNPSSLSSSSLLNHRKSFPPAAKVFRAAPTWKAADEMIGVSVPRKARSVSTKRSHECWASSGGLVAEPIHRQASTSPVRTTASAMGMGASQSPASPSSSNASVRKKIKPNGPKLRPPKSSSKSSSSAQDEIEIEIAEVLYGMMRQPQGPTRQETMPNDSREANNKSSSDGKSRVSSPISNSQSAQALSSSVQPQNSSSAAAPLSAVAPKRKRPRPVKYDEESSAIFTVRSSPISSTTKAESDQPSKVENCPPNFDKNSGSAAENGAVSYDLTNPLAVPASSEAQPESIKLENNISSDSKMLTEESDRQDAGLGKEEPRSPKTEKKDTPVPRLDDDREDVKATKANQALSESENQREQKFQIDLMASPPPLRSSPERDVEINFGADAKPTAIDVEREVKHLIKEGEKTLRMGKEDGVAIETEKVRAMAEEAEAQKPVSIQKERNIDLQLDLEKADRDSGSGNVVGKRHNQNSQRQQQQPNSEKAVQSNSLPLSMSVPSWPGGLPPMGYMAPLQGLVSMDGTTVSSAAIPPPHLLFQQPRPKRCATHCYIARNISFLQQIARMNPFWPAAAGSASLYGAKPCNLNVAPPTELHVNPSSRAANSGQDKGHGLAVFPGHVGKDKGSQAANMDNAQRKQILLQQALPPGPPSNILHGPAFIFPLNQQQAAAAASVRPGSVKSPPATGSATSSSTSNAASVSTSGTGAASAAAPTMSFSYPNIAGNETQYLAILQNNAYPFPIPAHVGGPPAFRGTHAQALPFFNGSFYSSQMLHPSQLQQQQLPAQSQQQNQLGHQNASISSGSSSSQKHLQNQQQKPNANGSNSVGGGGGSLQGFPAPKIQPLQPLQQLQQQQVQQQQQQLRQQLQNHQASHAARQIDSEMGGEDSPSTADSRQSRATMSIYGQNYAMPMQPANFTLMTPASIGGGGASAGANGNHGDKKQSQGPKSGVETSQAFAVSFASINGATGAPGLDLSSIAQNHTILQSHNYQIMAAHAAQAAHQKKNYRISEEGKTGCDSSNPDDDRKAMGGKIPSTVGQSIAFSRPDVSDSSISTLTGNTVIDSSARSLNLGSAPSRASVSVVPAATNNNATSTQQQLQRQQHHHQQQQQHQLIQLQKQQFAVAAARSKTPSTSNGSVYSDHLPSTSALAVKYPNSVSAFPQNLVQSSSTATQSPQWKNSARTTTSQSPSPSLASTPSSSVKALPQQQGRTQPGHTQISFAANPKSSSAPQVQPSGSTQSPSPPVMVGSPTTSSMSKSAGSPRTTSTSTSNKVGQASSLSSQQAKNSQPASSHKSSPVGGRNIPSILSSPQLTQSSAIGVKPQLPQQQQQISKQSLQQAQLFFSNAYMHPQASQSNNSTTAAPYYLPRRGPEQQQRQGSSGTSSNGMLSLCPTVSLVNTSTSDSSKVVASAASLKGGSLPTQTLLHPAQFAAAQSSGNHHQFVPPFPYVHAVPSAVQVKPAEQKQPAGE